ncbi:hypothetical protein FOIG_08141 [Fusarium odoratissimum NRRL 54006]|uniref:Uncharacterized protein n=1 Tax=Fusarium odoratissimum (strain NRRL 54006) TaxID=1089451 RepID=X0KTJ5_FUSO5|nr:uncharacterized protein FOIG_08141 [Fusarium odoratissimum NRRL 54006]EXM00095.1 hypothetical protein FOIG_08141 [Fusarium odoratissimum NRRL 54006]
MGALINITPSRMVHILHPSMSQLDEKRRFYGSRVETLDVANVRLVECSSEERSQQPSIQVAARPFYDFQGMIRNDWWMDTRYRQFGPDVQESYYQRPQQVRDLTISR